MKWIVLTLGIALAAVAAFWLLNKDQEERVPIRIGINPWPGFEYIQMADNKGYFKEEGAPIQFIRFSSLEDVRRAYERGQLDGMASTLVEVLQAHEDGAPSKIVLVTDFSNGADVLLARKEITGLAELKGKTVGIEPATLSAFILARALDKVGLSLDDVKTLGLNPLDMEEALLSGKIDAVHVYPPLSIEILKHTSNVVQIFDSTQIPGEVLDVVSMKPEVIANRQKDMDAFYRAMEKAHDFAKQHPQEAYQIMAGFEGIDAGAFAESLKGINILDVADSHALIKSSTLRKNIVGVSEVLRRSGVLKAVAEPGVFMVGDEQH